MLWQNSLNNLKYLLPTNNSFFKSPLCRLNSSIYFMNNNYLYLLALHLKLSVFYYATQFLDSFAYELPKLLKFFFTKKNTYSKILKSKKLTKNKIIYVNHFFSPFANLHLFFFTLVNFHFSNSESVYTVFNNKLLTLEDLFLNAAWLERENIEMSGLFFFGKSDTRNLLMMYGDFFFPLYKLFPSIGVFEIFYDVVSDYLYRSFISLQV
jgi:NADH:ubiquinone oxidoreductase subunit C